MDKITANVIARFASKTISGPQKEVVELVRSGKLQNTETGNRVGNIVALLIQKGVLGAEHITHLKSEETYHGRHIPSAWAITRIFVREVHPEKPSAKMPKI